MGTGSSENCSTNWRQFTAAGCGRWFARFWASSLERRRSEPKAPGVAMQIFGLMIVRNEADIVRVNVLHHLAVGVNRFLIVDNGSEDGTDQILHDLSLDGRVSFTRYSGPWRQAEITTQLALEAFRRGADWV